ncbi:MAG: hypothetical protein J7K21_03330 [Desulfurococcales archaeon]|nr:hypothetical protein [Desulfurococcales archaeon]
MSVTRPSDFLKRKREVIEEITRDLSPGVRDEARRILENLSMEELMDRRRVLEKLRKKGLG